MPTLFWVKSALQQNKIQKRVFFPRRHGLHVQFNDLLKTANCGAYLTDALAKQAQTGVHVWQAGLPCLNPATERKNKYVS
jgi:hypothetical protein